jgi:hypothetical protein
MPPIIEMKTELSEKTNSPSQSPESSINGVPLKDKNKTTKTERNVVKRPDRNPEKIAHTITAG